MSPRVLGLGLAVVAGLATFALWPRGPKTPEGQIRQLIAQCVAAAEKKDVGTIAEAISDDFRGPEGTGKAELRGVLLSQLLRGQAEVVSVFNPRLEVSVDGDEAATFSGVFVFARGKAASAEALPPGAVVSAHRIEGALRLRDGQWRFVRASDSRIEWP